MSNDRDTIFSSIRSALERLPEKSEYPEWSDALALSNNIDLSESLKEQFAERLKATSGRYFDSVHELGEFLKSEASLFGYCDPDLAGLFSGIEGISFDTEYDMAKVDDYLFGITKASSAIAESGTIVLKDSETSARLGALAPWIHIAVIREDDIDHILYRPIKDRRCRRHPH
jgi:L-lactate dehydrogenase complex protein LldG